MSIQPIDLQTMYSQLSNVSKTLSGNQQAQLTEAMQQQNKIQRNMEQAAKVQQTSNEKATATGINQNGSGSGSAYGRNNKKPDDKNTQSEDENHPKKSDSEYLGTIIDIMR